MIHIHYSYSYAGEDRGLAPSLNKKKTDYQSFDYLVSLFLL